MKKMMIAVLASLLIFSGCTQKKTVDTSNGPVVSQDMETDEEKELKMIQACIDDYNNDLITQRESELNTVIPPLPLEISSLPEISSLKDLQEQKDDESKTNTVYIGSYTVQDRYTVIFSIYKPAVSFWLNGQIRFQIAADQVTENDPKFADYRTSLASLLAQEPSVLNWLYGIDVTLASAEGPTAGYYEVLGMGDSHPKSIADVKALAEQVFTTDYLQSTYYPSAFESEDSVYKEINGKLYCAGSELTSLTSIQYDTSRIAAVKEENGQAQIDLLTIVQGVAQPDLKRIVLQKTASGWRLPAAY